MHRVRELITAGLCAPGHTNIVICFQTTTKPPPHQVYERGRFATISLEETFWFYVRITMATVKSNDKQGKLH